VPLDIKVDLSSGVFVIDGDPALLPKKGAEPPIFGSFFMVAKLLDASRCHLAWR